MAEGEVDAIWALCVASRSGPAAAATPSTELTAPEFCAALHLAAAQVRGLLPAGLPATIPQDLLPPSPPPPPPEVAQFPGGVDAPPIAPPGAPPPALLFPEPAGPDLFNSSSFGDEAPGAPPPALLFPEPAGP